MRHRREHGMATAEYTVGTLGAVFLAAFLFRLGFTDGWLFDELKGILERALRPGVLLDLLRHAPMYGFGRQ